MFRRENTLSQAACTFHRFSAVGPHTVTVCFEFCVTLLAWTVPVTLQPQGAVLQDRRRADALVSVQRAREVDLDHRVRESRGTSGGTSKGKRTMEEDDDDETESRRQLPRQKHDTKWPAQMGAQLFQPAQKQKNSNAGQLHTHGSSTLPSNRQKSECRWPPVRRFLHDSRYAYQSTFQTA